LRWGLASDIAAIVPDAAPDLVIGADIVYREEEMELLLQTLVALGAKRSILAIRRRDTIVPQFISKLAHRGLEFDVRNIATSVVLVSIMSQASQPTKGKSMGGPARVGWGGQ
jgi:hypothetical protein